MDSGDGTYEPVTLEHYQQVGGPFFHGTRVELEIGAELIPGHTSNFQGGRVSNNIYFTSLVETAAWGAELATALSGTSGRGHIYQVQPVGPFEDDPNVTNKKFAGNPTRSYRSRHPLRVVAELADWTGHEPAVLATMLESLARLRAEGRDVIYD